MQVKRITFINKPAASKEASEPQARATPQARKQASAERQDMG